jgi:hypothetical protein
MTLALSIGASAQVASLVSPEESPVPDAETSEVVEFEDRDDALLAFAQCMRDNGVDMDDPVAGQRGRILGGGPGGGGGLDRLSDEFQVATEACGSILESARPDIDPEAEQERLEEELAFAQCFRDSGYPDYPDPALDTDGRLQRGGQQFGELGIDRRSEEFQNTRATCADELGIEQTGRGPGGGLGPSGPGGN